MSQKTIDLVQGLQDRIVSCSQCQRLTAWCQQVAQDKVKRFSDRVYWGKPVPSFGDASARLLIVGLAPAAHGANRTGRMFTGDRSGDWLYRALYRAGFANQETATDREDGLVLTDAYITAVAHCAPPDNKPLPAEVQNCRPYLQEELLLLQNATVVIALGKLAFDAMVSELKQSPKALPQSKAPQFSHGACYQLTKKIHLIASYHPSQQNTFTGKLTEPMFDAIFAQAKKMLQKAELD
jgi:uracil-DNA glycosylase